MTEPANQMVNPETGELEERVGFDFVTFAGTHRKGGMNIALTEAMDALIAEVNEVGRKGQLVITLTFTPDHSKLDPIVSIDDVIKTKPPKRDSIGAIYFLQSTDGQISRDQPQQSIPGLT